MSGQDLRATSPSTPIEAFDAMLEALRFYSENSPYLSAAKLDNGGRARIALATAKRLEVSEGSGEWYGDTFEFLTHNPMAGIRALLITAEEPTP